MQQVDTIAAENIDEVIHEKLHKVFVDSTRYIRKERSLNER